MFLVFDWWLDVIWLKSHRNATNCIDFNIVIRILNTPVSAKMAQGQRKWHVVIIIIFLFVCVSIHFLCIILRVRNKHIYIYKGRYIWSIQQLKSLKYKNCSFQWIHLGVFVADLVTWCLSRMDQAMLWIRGHLVVKCDPLLSRAIQHDPRSCLMGDPALDNREHD